MGQSKKWNFLGTKCFCKVLLRVFGSSINQANRGSLIIFVVKISSDREIKYFSYVVFRIINSKEMIFLFGIRLFVTLGI